MDEMQNMRLTQSCAKVFIPRDYSEGISVKFDSKLPPELVGKIDTSEFANVIDHINAIYADAERLSARTYFENCFACLTAYTLLMCMPTYYEKCVKKASAYITDQNDQIFIPKGLLMIDPMERGLRCIEICMINEPALPNTTGNNSKNNNNNNSRQNTNYV